MSIQLESKREPASSGGSSPLSPLRLTSGLYDTINTINTVNSSSNHNTAQSSKSSTRAVPSVHIERVPRSPLLKKLPHKKHGGTIFLVNGKPILLRKPLKNGFDLELSLASFGKEQHLEIHNEVVATDEDTNVDSDSNHIANANEINGNDINDENSDIKEKTNTDETNVKNSDTQEKKNKEGIINGEGSITEISVEGTDTDVNDKNVDNVKDELLVNGHDINGINIHNNKEKPTMDSSKRARELADILLTTRKLLQSDCNVVDPLKYDPTGYHEVYAEDNTKISRSTFIRAEKVKSMFGVKYLYLQRVHDWNVDNADRNQHPGVEGVYNPLQIIRNRKIRAKYREYAKPLTIKTIPLACNVFSKHNNDAKHPWRMLWAIELSEQVSDVSWRIDHWHELKGPKGKLWFPPSASSSEISTRHSRSSHMKRRLHDKLFNDDDDKKNNKNNHNNNDTIDKEDDRHKQKESDKDHSRRPSTATTASSDSDHIFRISRAKSPHKKLRSRVKKRAKKLYHGSSSSSDEEPDVEPVLSKNLDILKQQMFKKVSLSPEESDKQETEQITGMVLGSLTSIPLIKIDESKDFDINEVEFTSMEKKPEEDAKEIEMAEPDEKMKEKQIVTAALAKRDEELSVIVDNFRYFEQVVNVKTNYLLKVYPNYTGMIGKKINHIIYKQLHDVFHLTVSISDDHLPEYEALYHGFRNEVKSIVHMINDDYSVKIDNLLSNSDRSISEINASLSLELRKVNERLDKLNSSLFSNVVSETLRDSEQKMKIRDGTNHKIMYFCLENLIVIFLRLIWVIVNVYKVGEKIFTFGWNLIRLVFSLI